MLIAFRVVIFLILLIVSMRIVTSSIENNFDSIKLLRGAVYDKKNSW